MSLSSSSALSLWPALLLAVSSVLPLGCTHSSEPFDLGSEGNGPDSTLAICLQRLDSVRQTDNDVALTDVLWQTAQRAYIKGDFALAVECDLEGVKLADKAGDTRGVALFDYNYGCCLTYQGATADGIAHIQQALTMLAPLKDSLSRHELIRCYEGLMSAQVGIEDYAGAIESGKKREQLIEKYRAGAGASLTEADSLFLDVERGLTSIRLANLYAYTGQMQESQPYLQDFFTTAYAQTPKAQHDLIDYYWVTDQPQALLRAVQDNASYFGNDTIDLRYAAELEYAAEACSALGQMARANDYLRRMASVKDSLSRRLLSDKSAELQALYQVQESRMKQAYVEKRYYLTLAVALALLLLLLTLWRYNYTMRRKNRLLAQKVDRLMALERQGDEPEEPALKMDEDLRQRVKGVILSEQLYLQSDLDVRQLADALDVTQKSIYELFKAHPEFENLDDYLNRLRVAHACELLRKDDVLTIEAIGQESGFKSARTFYRWFSREVGMTPREYRAASK